MSESYWSYLLNLTGLIKEEKMKTIDQQINELGLGAGDECFVTCLGQQYRYLVTKVPSYGDPCIGNYCLVNIYSGETINGICYHDISVGFRKEYKYESFASSSGKCTPEGPSSCEFTATYPKKEQPTVQEQLIKLGMREGDLVMLYGYPRTFLVVTEGNTPFIRVGDLQVTGINASRIKVVRAFKLKRGCSLINYTLDGIRQDYKQVKVD